MRGLGDGFGCCLLFTPCLIPVVGAEALHAGREREEPHEEPYSEGRESHASTSFA